MSPCVRPDSQSVGQNMRLKRFLIQTAIFSKAQVGVDIDCPPSSQGASGVPRTHDRRVHADLRVYVLATVPPILRII
ncbi:hypothetical protein PoB_005909800 [Plakobranchus ocellatus]|uniref:Uncharacterized protein n=1 Tax=Plakobranchus ocellatus TaxID=259542 RepID=A0AAV4CMN2_9GAST|nr:hypothetical protein PoB_005909800 [Plakobranchus ocellatus]